MAKELYSRIKLLVKIKNVYGHTVLEAAGDLSHQVGYKESALVEASS